MKRSIRQLLQTVAKTQNFHPRDELQLDRLKFLEAAGYLVIPVIGPIVLTAFGEDALKPNPQP